jgi:aryl-alcohol dehydrogenase-like predicted oxidoreductase
MDKRPLGNSGLSVAPLAFGGNVFGWTADQPTSFRLLDRFVDAGFNLVDTADAYSRWVPGHAGGESETVIGNWLAQGGKRERIVLATKVGMEVFGGKGLGRAWIEKSVEGSLKRLKTDYIDLYQAHIDDPDTPMEETLEAFGRLVKAGKVRAIGASNFQPARLREALETSQRLGLPRYETLQPEYNLYERGFEGGLLPVVKEYGIGVIPFFALARGFLTGKYRTLADTVGRPRESGLKKFFEGERGTRVLAALDQVAAARGSTPAKVAIAWVMARPGISAPIASATSLAQLEELLDATRLALTPAEVAILDAA